MPISATCSRTPFIAAFILCGVLRRARRFDEHGSDDLCAPRRFGLEALLAAFLLTHIGMQTQLLARGFIRLMTVTMTMDGDTLDAVNDHLLQVSNTRNGFSYMDKLTIDDMFRAVILATFNASGNLPVARRTIKSLMTWPVTMPCPSL